MKLRILFFVLLLSTAAFAQKPVSQQLADTAMNRIWVDARNHPGIPRGWTYEQGVVLKAIEQMWYATGDAKYFRHIQKGMDYWIDEKGNHKDYHLEEYNIDHITPGIAMLTMFKATNNEKYKKIVELLRSQLKTHPRTKEGGFWHKKIYPWQMWLDGLYMGEPFYTEYSVLYGEDNFNDIANQFVWMEKHARDEKTGLLYHGWDESKEQKWADKTTGRSPHFWGRAMGWYAMGLVDVLDFFPKDHPRRAELIAILNREAAAIEKVQDKKSGVWWDILDLPGKEKNYLESSASAMFVYALAKGVREGYLPEKYWKVAEKGWAGIQKEFIKVNAEGNTDWEGTVSVSGLGGNPYRDGSYEYYMSEKLRTNDAKGIGPAIRAALMMEAGPGRTIGKGKTVLLDDYFNREIRKDKMGRDQVWHYKFDEKLDSGYYQWGEIFRGYWAKTAHLSTAPTAANLSGASVYIIVDPDTEKETAAPNFIKDEHINAIADWVKKGGVLVMMGNDFGNVEFDHWNKLASKFGVEFNKDSKFKVLNNDYQMGKVVTNTGNPIFTTPRTIFIKEVSTLKLSGRAKPVLQVNGDNIMATVKYGKGTVFVLGDPWIYNEYSDGRRLPAEFQNFEAAQDLSRWLLTQAKKK
jgi:unsaturated rhamnogalacturonyl hydrolase